MRWRKEIERYAPDDLEEFERLVKTALDTPEPGEPRRNLTEVTPLNPDQQKNETEQRLQYNPRR